MAIKIITGHSNGGGSTLAHINLVNLFNENGYEAVLYGPDPWHLDKCKSGLHKDFAPKKDDTVICHFIKPPFRPNVNKFILSLHEKHLFPLKYANYKIYDKIHYIRESQRQYHNVDWPYFECMYVQNKLEANPKMCKGKVAGIIGSMDPNKQIEQSIQRALNDGFKDIRLFGKIIFEEYYQKSVKPLIEQYPEIIKEPIYIENPQDIYDQITDVYHTSKSEVCPMIQGECMLTKTEFHGNDQTEEPYNLMTDEEILKVWKEELKL